MPTPTVAVGDALPAPQYIAPLTEKPPAAPEDKTGLARFAAPLAALTKSRPRPAKAPKALKVPKAPRTARTPRPGKAKPGTPGPATFTAKPSGAAGAPTTTVKREPATAARQTVRPAPGLAGQDSGQGREAQLVVSRIEPWSVMKFSFIISLIGGVVLFVAVAAIFYGLQSVGVFHAIEKTVGLVTAGKASSGTNASKWFSSSTVLGYTIIADVVDIVMITALATLGAVIYNLVTHLSGGIEVTLKETD